MYEEYWQLEAKPFEAAHDLRFSFASETQKASLHKLRYVIENRRSAALLSGPSGIGKTLLVQTLSEQFSETATRFVQVVFPLMTSRDLLVYLAEQVGAPPADPPQYTVEESLRRLQFVFEENTRRGQHTVVVVDEAQLLEDSGLLETLRLLLNLQPQGQPAFTLLLVGQLPLLAAMQRNATLEERLEMKMMLKPFCAEETTQYIEHRLQVAGATRTIFAPDALQLTHQLTQGIPRKINRLCDLALVVGCAARQPTIDATQIQSVHDELLAVSVAA
ncbi:MAG: AAA family ATPase [Planctomycetes bacterium]|nr:AAA family ATPase [Planctomycetota bacterium]